MVISVSVKLYLSEEQNRLFSIRVSKFKDCVNKWIDIIRDQETTKLRDLQGDVYQSVKKQFGEDSNFVQLAEFTAIRMVRTAKRRRKMSPYLNKEFLKIKNTRLEDGKLVVLVGNRKGVRIKNSGNIPAGDIKESQIKKINNEWYAILSIDIEVPKLKNYKRFMGVDLGVAKTAVCCDWNGKNTRFFNGEPYRFKKNHFADIRKKVQPNIKEGNKYKFLKRISKKESNWVTNENHKISREIVNMAIRNKRSMAIEGLTGITSRLKVNKKTRIMLKGWSFRQLSEFIKYKAQMAGITVVEIDPRRTSKICSRCEYYSRSNRRTQNLFKCQKCNYETNADRNAAINIALRGTKLMA